MPEHPRGTVKKGLYQRADHASRYGEPVETKPAITRPPEVGPVYAPGGRSVGGRGR